MTSLSATRPLRLAMSKILISYSQAAAPKTRQKSKRMSCPNADSSVYSEVPFLPLQRFLMRVLLFNFTQIYFYLLLFHMENAVFF